MNLRKWCLFLFVFIMFVSCGKENTNPTTDTSIEPVIPPTPIDEHEIADASDINIKQGSNSGAIDINNIHPGQTNTYVFAHWIVGSSGSTFYTEDTLKLMVTDEIREMPTGDIAYVISEEIIQNPNLQTPFFQIDSSVSYQHLLYTSNVSGINRLVLALDLDTPNARSIFRWYGFDLPLVNQTTCYEDLDSNLTANPPFCNDSEMIAYDTNVEIHGKTYSHINIFLDASQVHIDVPAIGMLYHVEDGIIRVYSDISLGGFGFTWELVPPLF